MINGDLQAAVLLTSGSTGVPVPHGRTWRSVVLNAQAQAKRVQQALAARGVAGGLDTLTVVATVPPQHSYGFESSVLLALLGGAAFDSSPAFFPADIAQALARLPRPRALVTTPFHLKTLMSSGVELAAWTCCCRPPRPSRRNSRRRLSRRLAGRWSRCTAAPKPARWRAAAPPRAHVWQTLGALEIRSEVAADGASETPTEQFIVRRRPRDRADAAGRRAGAAKPDPLSPVRPCQRLDPRGWQTQLAGAPELPPEPHRGRHDGAFWLPPTWCPRRAAAVAFVVAPTLASAQIVKPCGTARLRVRAAPRVHWTPSAGGHGQTDGGYFAGAGTAARAGLTP